MNTLVARRQATISPRFDLAKSVVQLYGSVADGLLTFRKKQSRPQFARFTTDHLPCAATLEADSPECAGLPGSHHWARALTGQGHRVRPISTHYVESFLKLQKDTESIAEAAKSPPNTVRRDLYPAPDFALLLRCVNLAKDALVSLCIITKIGWCPSQNS